MAGCSGFCSFIFFIPFAGVGLATVYQAYRIFADKGQLGGALFVGGIGAIFAAIGLFGAIWPIYRGATRRSRNAPMLLPKPIPDGWQNSPWFPKVAKRTMSSRGRIQLTPEASNWTMFFTMLFMAVIWNGITWTGLIASYRQHKLNTGLIIFLGLFALIGAAILFGTIKQLLRIVLVGETSVEIDQEPVVPGANSTISLYQRGDFEIQQINVALVAQEVVTYGSGTDRTTHKEIVHEETIFTRTNARASSDRALAQADFKVSADAAPSFKSSNNALVWNIRVRMTIVGKPDVDQLFPVRVAPEVPRP
jgi:hypothetical protein